jgi:succinyl-CoA synthetase alpha subunit
MAILLDDQTRVLVQGITGRKGRAFTEQMILDGTQVVAGVTPNKGGEWGVRGRPVFDSVRAAVNATEANTSVIAVGAGSAVDAIYEAADAGIRLIVCVTDGIPIVDMLRVTESLRASGVRLIGANAPGVLIPHVGSAGMIPMAIARRGSTALIARSGSLLMYITAHLSALGIGQSALVGIGGDPVIGTTFVDVLMLLEDDLDTERIILLGEIGGRAEFAAADYIRASMTKPVYALIVGQSAPPGVRLGHPSAPVDHDADRADLKSAALRAASVQVARTAADLFALLS